MKSGDIGREAGAQPKGEPMEENREITETQEQAPAPPQKAPADWRAYACILAGAALWGMIGLWNRRLMSGGLSPWSIVLVRNTGGLALLSAIFAVRDRSVFRVKREHLKYFFGTGVVSVLLFTVCYFSCQKITSLAVASILLYTAPSIVVILSAILWKEPVTKKKLLALLLTLLGCALVCGIFAGNLTVTPAGILLGLGAGFFYALYSIFGRYALRAGYDARTTTVWTFVFAGVGSLFFIRPAELAALSAAPSLWLGALGLVAVSTVAPYLLYTSGLARVESGKASIMASLEPVVASLVGVLVFQEPMSGLTLLGIVCVLAGVVILR
ncbi:MAG: EamA family transporter [Oscillibacter sp.]|nr:EamA family transporter [Oscillibacter sp.]MEA4994044.1 EamA family transporter [Oscillibacter sp.]